MVVDTQMYRPLVDNRSVVLQVKQCVSGPRCARMWMYVWLYRVPLLGSCAWVHVLHSAACSCTAKKYACAVQKKPM
jgi:hypothetical protein